MSLICNMFGIGLMTKSEIIMIQNPQKAGIIVRDLEAI